MRKNNKNKVLLGQLNIWDITQTEIITQNKSSNFDKDTKPLELAKEQQEFLNKNQVMENENLSRVIKYCGGGLGIEFKHNKCYSTIYINALGKKEFEFNNKSPVLPMDKIIYYNEDLKANELQEEKLKELLQSEGIKRVVRRKGDENILVECEDKVISINSKGWKLEFNSLNKVQYTTEDVLSEDLVEVIQGEKIKLEKEIAVGNTIEIRVKNKRFIAEVFRIYNNGDTISILFDNGTKHTAIHKSCISKIIA